MSEKLSTIELHERNITAFAEWWQKAVKAHQKPTYREAAAVFKVAISTVTGWTRDLRVRGIELDVSGGRRDRVANTPHYVKLQTFWKKHTAKNGEPPSVRTAAEHMQVQPARISAMLKQLRIEGIELPRHTQPHPAETLVNRTRDEETLFKWWERQKQAPSIREAVAALKWSRSRVTHALTRLEVEQGVYLPRKIYRRKYLRNTELGQLVESYWSSCVEGGLVPTYASVIEALELPFGKKRLVNIVKRLNQEGANLQTRTSYKDIYN